MAQVRVPALIAEYNCKYLAGGQFMLADATGASIVVTWLPDSGLNIVRREGEWVLGMDGKPLKTRDGGTITLSALLQEAESRAMASIHEEGLEVAESELSMVAKAVGIGAVKYADLRQNRLSDYQFDWDKMISFRGNAGPYLQYAHARVRAMFRKGQLDFEAFGASEITLQHPSELALGKQLLRWDEIIHLAAESYQPHLLCDHLYAVARHFSNFYQECPVLKADEPERTGRLALAKLCALQLRMGLEFLGIQALERM